MARDAPLLIERSARRVALLGAAAAAALAAYYDSERPYPRSCRPPETDKWQHCYVGCRVASSLPAGSFSASFLAVLKEIRDQRLGGEFSWPDVIATLQGTWDCLGYESCEACCCETLGGVETE